MWKATGLYNGMIAPLLPYVIKGVIWYQGESNVGRAEQYQTLFPAQIQNWRSKWNQGDFPFLFVQLPDFGDIKDQPSESGWAMLREAQVMSLSVPNTGMAVTIDVGEWNDIHPINKKDVGKRLALIAENKVYGDKTVIDSGPVFRAMKIKGNKAILSFDNTGSGLMAKEGESLKHFAIAGADKKFVWAEAEIKGRKVVVWNEQISLPVAVRYAWADAPQGINFYNKEGLPARPFRTDN
ncbi:MAG: sialate O-acetylesterase [Bacteroidia bacterium]|nr:sialate O-acetylesterase [Bacteroidia bacterium]